MNKWGGKKTFKTLFICSLLIFLLCSCNKINDADAHKGDDINENTEKSIKTA